MKARHGFSTWKTYHGVLERKIVRIIYGLMQEGEVCKIRNNRELRNLYEEADTVAAVKTKQLRWLEHVIRMRSDRDPKMAFKRKPERERRRVRQGRDGGKM